MYSFKTAAELLRLAQQYRKPISEIAIRYEMGNAKKSRKEIFQQMEKIRVAMEEAIKKGVRSNKKAFMGLAGGDARKIFHSLNNRNMLSSRLTRRAMAYAVATGEQNACMGRIVAFPTAGGAGVLPGVTFAYAEERKISKRRHLNALFTASAIGILIMQRATLSAAVGGCQAEVGAAVAMAAAAITEMRKGTPKQCLNACAIALKSYLGLVCDPLAGLVMVPCIKRNALGSAVALAASDLASCGVQSFIPLDEIIEAMNKIAKVMPAELKETALGGLATTKTGLRVRKELGLPKINK